MVVVPVYTSILKELVRPGSVTWKKLVTRSIPFVVTPLCYWLTELDFVYYVNIALAGIYGLSYTIWAVICFGITFIDKDSVVKVKEETKQTKESFEYTISLDEKISKIFINVGIPPHIKGYAFLREGVKMAVEDPDVINNITK